MKRSRQALEDLRAAIVAGYRAHGGMRQLCDWLEAEFYGGDITEMSAEEQEVMKSFLDVIEFTMLEYIQDLGLSLRIRERGK